MKLSGFKFLAVFVFAGVWLTPFVWAESLETCEGLAEDSRSQALSELHRFELNFKDAEWHYRKYQEMVYSQLWEAVQKKKLAFPKELQADGEILFERYRRLSDEERSQADMALEAALETLRNIHSHMIFDMNCGPHVQKPSVNSEDEISSFSNCVFPWNQEIKAGLRGLSKILRKYEKAQLDFSDKVEDSVMESPSDHLRFEARFHDHLWLLTGKSAIMILGSLRDLQEKLETSWPAGSCCRFCGADARLRKDPVLSQVRLDPQSSTGAAGNVVNGARLMDAFKRFDAETEPQEKAEN